MRGSIYFSPVGNIVAELGASHNGKYLHALELMQVAKDAGADAFKLQCYTPDTLVKNPDYRLMKGPWAGCNLRQLYEQAATPREWFSPLFDAGERIGIDVFSSVFDLDGLEFLESLNCPRYKIASFELVDLHLIEQTASTGKEIILSTGMATLREVEAAVNAASRYHPPTLLHCVSAYPTPFEEANLGRIPELRRRFGLPVGISDHSKGSVVPIAATALGIQMIEKHIRLKQNRMGGPDAFFAMEPQEFAEMVRGVANAALALTSVEQKKAENPSRALRRSLWATAPIAAGEPFTPENIGSFRPALGLSPAWRSTILESKASQDIPEGAPISWEMVSGSRTTDEVSA